MNHYLWMWQTRKKLCPIWALSFSTYIDSTVMRNIIISMFHRHKNVQLLYRCRMINFRIDRKIKCLLFLKIIIIKKTNPELVILSRIKIPDNLPTPMSSEMFKSLRHLFLWLGSWRALWSGTETTIWTFNLLAHHWSPLYGEKSWNVFLKNLKLFNFPLNKKKQKHEHLGWHGTFLFIYFKNFLFVNLAQIVDHQDGSSTWTQS